MKVAIESFTNCIPEIKAIIDLHWEELALDKDQIKLNPDWEKYKAVDASGCLQFVTLRTDFDQLVGYIINFVFPNMHYKDHIYAINDIYYVMPAYRDQGGGSLMVEYMEQDLKEKGVSVAVMETKSHKESSGFWKLYGYRPIGTKLSKVLK